MRKIMLVIMSGIFLVSINLAVGAEPLQITKGDCKITLGGIYYKDVRVFWLEQLTFHKNWKQYYLRLPWTVGRSVVERGKKGDDTLYIKAKSKDGPFSGKIIMRLGESNSVYVDYYWNLEELEGSKGVSFCLVALGLNSTLFLDRPFTVKKGDKVIKEGRLTKGPYGKRDYLFEWCSEVTFGSPFGNVVVSSTTGDWLNMRSTGIGFVYRFPKLDEKLHVGLVIKFPKPESMEKVE